MIKKIFLFFLLFLFSFSAKADERDLFKTVLAKAKAGEVSSIMEVGRRYANGIDVKKDEEEALKWYNQALSKRYPPVYTFFADAYYYGDKLETIKLNYAKAYDFYKRSAATGENTSAYMAGFMAFHGKGIKTDYQSAVKYFSDACPKNIYACIYLGIMTRYGIGVVKNKLQAEHYFSFQRDHAVQPVKDEGMALFNRGRRLIYQSPSDAVDVLLKSEEMGVKEAGELAKIVILNDDEAYRNSVEGIKIIRKEADSGNLAAMNRLGEVYYEGRMSTRKDIAMAKKWFTKATEKGDVMASRNLGLLYLNEEKDTVNALRWFSNAGNGGDGVSSFYVAQIYSSDDMLKDIKKAEEWYLKSAQNGEEKSQAVVAMMYVTGSKTLKQNLADAYAWFTLAENGFSGKEKDRLHETALLLKTHLNEQELEKANEIIIKYK